MGSPKCHIWSSGKKRATEFGCRGFDLKENEINISDASSPLHLNASLKRNIQLTAEPIKRNIFWEKITKCHFIDEKSLFKDDPEQHFPSFKFKYHKLKSF